MRKSVIKLGLAFLLLVVLIVLVRLSNDDSWKSLWMGLFIFIGTPLLILSVFDLGRSLREVPNPSWLIRVLGILFSVPQALFALVGCGKPSGKRATRGGAAAGVRVLAHRRRR